MSDRKNNVPDNTRPSDAFKKEGLGEEIEKTRQIIASHTISYRRLEVNPDDFVRSSPQNLGPNKKADRKSSKVLKSVRKIFRASSKNTEKEVPKRPRRQGEINTFGFYNNASDSNLRHQRLEKIAKQLEIIRGKRIKLNKPGVVQGKEKVQLDKKLREMGFKNLEWLGLRDLEKRAKSDKASDD